MSGKSIKQCLSKKKPVYLELACDLATQSIPHPNALSMITAEKSDPLSLSQCIQDAILCISQSTRPVLLAGSSVRGVEYAVKRLAEKIGCGVAGISIKYL